MVGLVQETVGENADHHDPRNRSQLSLVKMLLHAELFGNISRVLDEPQVDHIILQARAPAVSCEAVQERVDS